MCLFSYVLRLKHTIKANQEQSSRGVTFRHRHLLQDLYSLMSVFCFDLLFLYADSRTGLTAGKRQSSTPRLSSTS